MEMPLLHVHERFVTNAALDLTEDGVHLSQELYAAYCSLNDQCFAVGEHTSDSMSEALKRASGWVEYAKRWQHNMSRLDLFRAAVATHFQKTVSVSQRSAEADVAEATESFSVEPTDAGSLNGRLHRIRDALVVEGQATIQSAETGAGPSPVENRANAPAAREEDEIAPIKETQWFQ
ncbi:hypothetical protein FGB62_97g05 [Gracilaria domingensis]|nr:hypothetical protein FGB62_97g05 [Gracilaria domingensis]